MGAFRSTEVLRLFQLSQINRSVEECKAASIEEGADSGGVDRNPSEGRVVDAEGEFARAAETKLGNLTIDAAWARPSIGKRGNSAAYMTITNKGGTADTLIAVSIGGTVPVILKNFGIDPAVLTPAGEEWCAGSSLPAGQGRS